MEIYKPTEVKQNGIFILLFLLLVQSMFSISVHSSTDNIFSVLAWASAVVLTSQLMYTAVSSFKYTKYLCLKLFGAADAPRKTHDTPASVWVILCDVRYFFEHETSKKYTLTQGGLWRMFYPLSLGIFGLFVCIPMYDESCTCCMAFGFALMGMHAEFVRGRRYYRPVSRRVLFSVTSLLAVLSCTSLFGLTYTTGIISTNHGASTSVKYTQQHHVDIFTDISEAFGNASHAHAVQNETKLISSFMHQAAIMNPDVVQYVQWTLNSYPRRMALCWITSLFTPVLLCYLPTKQTPLFVIETIHTSVSFLAASTLAVISMFIQRPALLLLRTTNAINGAYLLASPLITWVIMIRIFEYKRRQLLHVPAMVFVCATYIKTLVQNSALLREKLVNDVAIVTGLAIGLYFCACFVFIRLENTAVTNEKWGSAEFDREDTERGVNLGIADDDDSSEMDFDDSVPISKIMLDEAVEQVLEGAQRDLALAKKVIEDNRQEITDNIERGLRSEHGET
jgi:hypothetical protein